MIPDPALTQVANVFPALHGPIAAIARAHPDRIALHMGEDSWTYGALEESADDLARRLRRDHGLQPQGLVALCCGRSASLICALLAVLKAQGAFLIVDPNMPPARRQRMLQVARPVLIVCFDGDFVIEPGSGAGTSNKGFSERIAKFSGDPPTYVAFTSGSTGRSKAVVGGRSALFHFFQWYVDQFPVNGDDRFALLSGLGYDPLLRDIFPALWSGACVHIPDRELLAEPASLHGWLLSKQITILHTTPQVASMVAQVCGASTLQSLRRVFVGGDQCRWSVVQGLEQAAPGVEVINFYGATETPQAVAWFVADGSTKKLSHERVPIGRGIRNVQLLIIDSKRLALPGVIGEVCVRTPYLSHGYLDEPDQTQAKFRVNPFTNVPSDRIYLTGDLGRYLPSGDVELVGRADDQLKVRGHRVEPAEVRAEILECGGMADAVIFDCSDAQGDVFLACALVPGPGGADGLLDRVSAFVRERLPGHMRPQRIIVVSALPLTSNGKIDRDALRQLAKVSPAVMSSDTDAVECELIRLWSEGFGHPLDSEADFFDLGGHSVTAAQLSLRVSRQFGLTVPASLFYQHSRLCDFADEIRHRLRGPLVSSDVGVAAKAREPSSSTRKSGNEALR